MKAKLEQAPQGRQDAARRKAGKAWPRDQNTVPRLLQVLHAEMHARHPNTSVCWFCGDSRTIWRKEGCIFGSRHMLGNCLPTLR